MTAGESSERLVYAFPDANIFIQFTMFTAVNWSELLEADRVCLVLAPSVMRELEKFKDDSSQHTRRDRVRDILSKLKPLLRASSPEQPAVISPGVTIFDITHEPMIEWQSRGLDPQVPDDRLLASILTFTPNVPGHVLLLTNDFPAERKATGKGIVSWEPEGKINRASQVSPLEKENQQLKQRNQVLERRIPKVRLGFWEGKTLTQRVTRSMGESKPSSYTDAQIETCITEIRATLDHKIEGIDSRVSPSRIKSCRYDCEHYLEKVWAYYSKIRAQQYSQRYRFDFAFENDGSAPIVGVSIRLDFPAGSFIVAVDDEHDDHDGLGDLEEPSEPAVPKPPQSYYSTSDSNFPPVPLISSPFSNLAREPEPRGPMYDYLNRSYVEYETPKLRHKESWLMDPIIAYVPIERPGGFSISYTVRADNLVEPIENKLHVVLNGQS